jgi:LytS/YehU family sensor histidine kinase
MIAKLAGLMRYALDSAERDRVSLREELDFVGRYLDLERHRFSDRLEAHVDVEVPDDALDTPVPPMVLQPLVENALRHGIAPSEAGGRVTVRVTERDDRLRVRVEDTGVGPDPGSAPAEADGTGLANTSTRLEHTYGPDAALHTAENDPTGFAVWFSIPRNGAT